MLQLRELEMNTRSGATARSLKLGLMRIRYFRAPTVGYSGHRADAVRLRLTLMNLDSSILRCPATKSDLAMGGVEALGAVESAGKLATTWADIKHRD